MDARAITPAHSHAQTRKHTCMQCQIWCQYLFVAMSVRAHVQGVCRVCAGICMRVREIMREGIVLSYVFVSGSLSHMRLRTLSRHCLLSLVPNCQNKGAENGKRGGLGLTLRATIAYAHHTSYIVERGSVGGALTQHDRRAPPECPDSATIDVAMHFPHAFLPIRFLCLLAYVCVCRRLNVGVFALAWYECTLARTRALSS